jgi:hypothetical protein
MKDANLSATSCKLWVMIEDPQSPWWQKLNFNSGFLLSEIHRHRKTTAPTELSHLIEEVSWPVRAEPAKKPWTLVGCKNHFDADWLFLIRDVQEFKSQDLEQIVEQLQIKNLRCFTPFEPSASLKARLEHCDLVTSSTN